MRILIVSVLSIVLSGCSTLLPGTTGLSNSQNQSQINIIDLAGYQPAAAKAVTAKPSSNISFDYDYQIGAGDIISVVVYDHPELTIPAGGFRSLSESGSPVHSDGTLYFPYAGALHVAGKTVGEVRDLLSQKLAKYIESPQVDVRVAAYYSQSVYVSGAVKQVGKIHLDNIPLTLVDAISRAGGISELGDAAKVTLARDGEVARYSLAELYKHGVASENVLLRHGDIVNVPLLQQQKVFVLGEVNRQQVIEIDPQQHISLTEAIAGSGGMDLMSANASGVFVIRQANDGNKLADVYQLNLASAVAFVSGTKFELQHNDVVYVTAAPISQWNRLLSQLVPTLSAGNSSLDTAIKIRSLSN